MLNHLQLVANNETFLSRVTQNDLSWNTKRRIALHDQDKNSA